MFSSTFPINYQKLLNQNKKVKEASTGWNGKEAGGPSRPIGRNKPKPKVVYRQKTKLGLGAGQKACVKPDPKDKSPAQLSSQVPSSSARPWVRLDAGQSGDPEATPDSGGSQAALRSQGMSGGLRTEVSSVGQSDCSASVGLESAEVSRDPRAVMSPTRVYPEQNQSVSQIDDDRAV